MCNELRDVFEQVNVFKNVFLVVCYHNSVVVNNLVALRVEDHPTRNVSLQNG